jgi:glycosyltransferase involved in cell wall biosynthesis
VAVLHLAGDSGDCRRRREPGALYRRLAGVLTPSAAGRRQVLADFGVARDRVHVVPNGVDVPAFPSGPAGRTVPRVGALGRLTEQKGFDVLVEAVRRLVADGTRLEVVIGGAGRDDARLRAAAAGLPVTFPGFVTDVRGFLAGLDVFCLPSRREALPLVLLEAMAEGLPCVATDVGDVAAAVGRTPFSPPGRWRLRGQASVMPWRSRSSSGGRPRRAAWPATAPIRHSRHQPCAAAAGGVPAAIDRSRSRPRAR